jgi:rfaE bifunctional protein nucleotidyltransferase chain/domain
MKKTQIEIIESKIFDWESFGRQREVWEFLDKKVVFTNGCFDIIHRGHVEYLAKASDYGDILVIGLNTDDSVRRLKGDNRPINDEKARAMVMAALKFVDAIVLFDQDTPYELIKLARPHVLVKGSDYTEETIVGADIVKENGGEVVTIDLVPGYSTSGIIDKSVE